MELKRKKFNKRGSIQDIAYLIILFFAFSLVCFIAYKILIEFQDNLGASDMLPQESKDALTKTKGVFDNYMDKIFLFVVITSVIVTFILATLIRVHPIFLVLYLISLIFLIFLAAVFSNAYQEFASNPEFIQIADHWIIMNYIMSNLPFIIAIVGFILMFILYKLNSNTIQ